MCLYNLKYDSLLECLSMQISAFSLYIYPCVAYYTHHSYLYYMITYCIIVYCISNFQFSYNIMYACYAYMVWLQRWAVYIYAKVEIDIMFRSVLYFLKKLQTKLNMYFSKTHCSYLALVRTAAPSMDSSRRRCRRI